MAGTRRCLTRSVVVASMAAMLWPGVGSSQDAPYGQSSRQPGFPVSPRQKWGREVQLAPPPSVLPPLVGSPVPEADGYAPQTADRVGLLSLLFARRFADLDRSFNSYQASFEKDFRKEHLPEDAQDAFGVADPRLEPLLDDWVRESPRSFGAWASRGAYRSERASQSRSAREAFERLRRLATADLIKALELRPRAISAFRTLVSRDDRAESRRWLDASIKICPECYRVRRAFLVTLLSPDGSLDEMEIFTREVAEHARSPKLKIFPGFVHWFEANGEADPRAAMVGYQKAMFFGEHWEFLYYRGMGQLRPGIRNVAAALKDFDRALELRPQIANVLTSRADVLSRNGPPERAAADLLLALRLDPTLAAESVFRTVLERLFVQVRTLSREGHPEEAIAPLRLARDLDPVGLATRAWAIEDRTCQSILNCPDSLDAYRSLGSQLGEDGHDDAVVELWTRYLGWYPNSPDGYLYRAVAQLRKGQTAACDADLSRARALGGKAIR